MTVTRLTLAGKELKIARDYAEGILFCPTGDQETVSDSGQNADVFK